MKIVLLILSISLIFNIASGFLPLGELPLIGNFVGSVSGIVGDPSSITGDSLDKVVVLGDQAVHLAKDVAQLAFSVEMLKLNLVMKAFGLAVNLVGKVASVVPIFSSTESSFLEFQNINGVIEQLNVKFLGALNVNSKSEWLDFGNVVGNVRLDETVNQLLQNAKQLIEVVTDKLTLKQLCVHTIARAAQIKVMDIFAIASGHKHSDPLNWDIHDLVNSCKEKI